MSRLYCPHCGREAGHSDREQLWFRGRAGAAWDNDPVPLHRLPISWHCPHCGQAVWLRRRPRVRRVVLDT